MKVRVNTPIIIRKGVLSLIIGLMCCGHIAGQSVADNWCIADSLGIKFHPDNSITTFQSISGNLTNASWSSPTGELLFYSSSDYLANREHTMMPPWFDSWIYPPGQPPLICPLPESLDKYFLFYQKYTDPNHINKQFYKSMNYVIVDLSLEGGLGAVDPNVAPVFLFDSSSSKISYTEKCDGSGYWVVGSNGFTGEYYVYDVSPSGVSSTPQVFQGPNGSLMGMSTLTGQMKFSPSGKYFAATNGFDREIIFFEFDNATGTLSNHFMLDFDSLQFAPYGLSFSPSEEFLYISAESAETGSDYQLWQFDISDYSPSAILNSHIILATYSGEGAYSMQLGPDGKIYFARRATYLGAVNHPDISGTACEPVDTAVSLNNRYSSTFLPQHSFNHSHNPIRERIICIGDTAFFSFDDSCNISLEWNFDDPGSVGNISSANNTFHVFSDTGVFDVKLDVQYSAATKTYENKVRVVPIDLPDIFPDTVIACDSSIKVDITLVDYLWSVGATTQRVHIDSTGYYSVTISNPCDTAKDSVYVVLFQSPQILKFSDTSVCTDDRINRLVSSQPNTSYLWSTGDTTASITIDTSLSPDLEPIEIWLTATNACGTSSDTMTVSFLPTPDASLPPDSAHCLDQSFFIFHKSVDSVNYLWSDSTSVENFRIDSTMSVWLMAENECGVHRDTFNVVFHPEINTELGEDTLICNGDSVVLDAAWPGASYVWNTGSTDSAITVSEPDNYIVTISSPPCQKMESRMVSIIEEDCDSADCKFSIPNVFTPNADGINDVLRITNTCQNLSFTVFIYNRWGQLVFSDKNSLSGIAWDGFVNGEAASAGTYFVVATHSDGKAQRGAVTLTK